MKNPNIILLFLMALVWTGCHKDKEINVKEAVVSNEEVTVSETQARFSWQVDFAGQFQTGVELSQNENMSDLRRVEAAKVEDRFQAVVDGLLEGTKYYYRILVWNKFSSLEQPVGHFTTLEALPDTTYYTIAVACMPEEGGLASGGGTFAEGDTCTVTATANAGYNFVNWTENESQVSTDSVYAFAVTGDRILVANFQAQPQPQSYTISVSANPSNGGTVTGGGTFSQGESCTVIATAAEGYTFDNWTEDGEVVSEDANYTFTVTSDRTLVANFSVQAPNTYNINVSPNPSNGGTVTGGGSYNQGASCTVTATANIGYVFNKWCEIIGDPSGGVMVTVSVDSIYTFTVTENRTLVANFALESYTISVSSNPTNGGTVYVGDIPGTIQGTYTNGQSCTVHATPKTGYIFTNWTESGNVVSDNAEYHFDVTNNRILVANFTKTHTITLSANPSEGGTVAGGGTYTQGTSCTVTATSKPGFTFMNWTENGIVVSENANYTFPVTADRILVAHFSVQEPDTYVINASPDPINGGTISGNQSPYTYGQTCSLTAAPASGYTFLRWTENGNQVSTNPNYSFTVTSNRTLVAKFQLQSYTISVSANPISGGTVSGGGQYNYGQSCTVTATAANGYAFTNWTENGEIVSTNTNYTFTVNGNRTLVANFVQTYTITVSSQPVYGGVAWGGGTYYYGQTCTVSVTPATGYILVNWLENGNVVSTSPSYTFTVTSNRNLVASFGHTVTVSSNPSSGGVTTGGGTYYHGQSCTVTATANNGYLFTNWTENGNVVSTNTTYQFDVTSDKFLVANFIQAPTGATVGLFSVSPTQQVWFSQGNLQYQASTNTWRFAENQWDFVGTQVPSGGNPGGTINGSDNHDISSTYSGWIDLFGWGTSGYNHGAVCYQPWSISGNNGDYNAYGNPDFNLYDQTGQADWGYNAISNGGNNTNIWRALTSDEWVYVFDMRNTPSDIRYAKANVNNVNGVILLPDNWSESYYPLNGTNMGGTSYNSNIITLLEWNTLEQLGAVFLPAAGFRHYAGVNQVNSEGDYWSASHSSNGGAYGMYFAGNFLHTPYNIGRVFGFSVRLVRSAQ